MRYEGIEQLSEALEHERFVGVTGEAEASKTHMLAAVANEQAAGRPTVTLDLTKTPVDSTWPVDISTMPNGQEPWKEPLSQVIEHLYQKRFGRERPEIVVPIEQHARQLA